MPHGRQISYSVLRASEDHLSFELVDETLAYWEAGNGKGATQYLRAVVLK
jgi:hypothetical protein